MPCAVMPDGKLIQFAVPMVVRDDIVHFYDPCLGDHRAAESVTCLPWWAREAVKAASRRPTLAETQHVNVELVLLPQGRWALHLYNNEFIQLPDAWSMPEQAAPRPGTLVLCELLGTIAGDEIANVNANDPNWNIEIRLVRASLREN